MGLFRRKPDTNPAADLLERLLRLEGELKAIQMEWEDTYEKMLRLSRRITKRGQDLAKREEAQEPPGAPIPGQPDLRGLDPISAAIHARRARAVPTRGDGSDR
ncbi:MAG: hypothetical protein ACRDV9_15000 [Acidimicrobiia bacterium]